MDAELVRWVAPLVCAAGADAGCLGLSFFLKEPYPGFSLVVMNVSIVLAIRPRTARNNLEHLRQLPAVAAAGALALEITGSKLRMMELFARSNLPQLSGAFANAIRECYRGKSVDSQLQRGAESLPFGGLKKGIARLRGKGATEAATSEAALSSIDLEEYYQRALSSLETRASLYQAAAFFAIVITTAFLPQLFATEAGSLAFVITQASCLHVLRRSLRVGA